MDRIGEYVVKRLIGEGGMGKVYEAEERLSKRRVALKVLRSELTRHEEGRRLFLNEMQILAHLEHPNLVRSLASIESDGQLVLVLEHLRGRTLRQELTRRGPLHWQEALEHAVRIAGALAVAHGQEPPIVHRDLKPENVMLTVGEGSAEDGVAVGLKVMDFGIAKVLEGVHGTNTKSIGTLQYMSPEQIDARTIDPRSDVYSLGLVFYEMLAGEPPFQSPSPRELLNLQCTQAPPPLAAEVRRGIPRGVEELVFAMLAKAPENRPQAARDVVEKLAPFRSASDEAPAVSARASRAAAKSTPKEPPLKSTLPSPTADEVRIDAPESLRAQVPRLDTIALVEKNATASREVPTWLALVAIVLLSLATGLTTYMIRLKSASVDRATTTTSAAVETEAAKETTARRGP